VDLVEEGAPAGNLAQTLNHSQIPSSQSEVWYVPSISRWALLLSHFSLAAPEAPLSRSK
jgi:hypothetical protein